MNRILQALFLATLLALLGCAGAPDRTSPSALSQEEQAWLKQHGPIQVGVFNDYPPIGYLDESGHPQGMAMDYWRLVARHLDLEIAFTPCAFRDQLAGLESGRFDSLSGIFSMEQRKKRFDFSRPYYQLNTSIFTQPELEHVTGWTDLQGLRIAVVEGDSGQSLAQKAGLTPKAVPSYLEAVLGLLHKTVDAIVLDELVVTYYASAYNALDRIRKAGEPVDRGNLCLPVRKGNRVLLSILNKGVQSVSEQDLRKIEIEWLDPKER